MGVNYEINKPWRAQIEITFGCDNRCPMCYKQVLNKPIGEYNCMNIRTAKEISNKMNKAGWNGLRIDFELRGEPTLNPQLNKITRIFRKNLKQSQILLTTNGNQLLQNKTGNTIKNFFKNGGNIILIDCYNNTLTKRKKQLQKEGYPITEYYKNKFNPYERHDPNKTKVICLMDDIKTNNNKKRTRKLHNWGGNVQYSKVKKYGIKPLQKSLNKRCVKPFRQIAIHYNGNIPLCCLDGAEQNNLGNIYKINDLNHFWKKNIKLNLIRSLLYNKRRDYLEPCNKCDSNGGMRIGLLPKMKQLPENKLKQFSQELKRI